MGDSPQQTPETRAADLARRQFLRRAAVAGAIVWVVPTIVTAAPAGALSLHSGPPKPPTGVDPIVTTPPAKTGLAPTDVNPPQLAFTGDENQNLLIAGLAATTAGAALIVMSNNATERLTVQDD